MAACEALRLTPSRLPTASGRPARLISTLRAAMAREAVLGRAFSSSTPTTARRSHRGEAAVLARARTEAPLILTAASDGSASVAASSRRGGRPRRASSERSGNRRGRARARARRLSTGWSAVRFGVATIPTPAWTRWRRGRQTCIATLGRLPRPGPSRLDDLAQRIEPAAAWNDLVLPEAQRPSLRESSRPRASATACTPSGASPSAACADLACMRCSRAERHRQDDGRGIPSRRSAGRTDRSHPGRTRTSARRRRTCARFDAARPEACSCSSTRPTRSSASAARQDRHDRTPTSSDYLLQAWRPIAPAILTTNMKRRSIPPSCAACVCRAVPVPRRRPARRDLASRSRGDATTPPARTVARLNVRRNIRNIAVRRLLAADAGEPFARPTCCARRARSTPSSTARCDARSDDGREPSRDPHRGASPRGCRRDRHAVAEMFARELARLTVERVPGSAGGHRTADRWTRNDPGRAGQPGDRARCPDRRGRPPKPHEQPMALARARRRRARRPQPASSPTLHRCQRPAPQPCGCGGRKSGHEECPSAGTRSPLRRSASGPGRSSRRRLSRGPALSRAAARRGHARHDEGASARFQPVRVHTDERSATSALAVNAAAYTWVATSFSAPPVLAAHRRRTKAAGPRADARRPAQASGGGRRAPIASPAMRRARGRSTAARWSPGPTRRTVRCARGFDPRQPLPPEQSAGVRRASGHAAGREGALATSAGEAAPWVPAGDQFLQLRHRQRRAEARSCGAAGELAVRAARRASGRASRGHRARRRERHPAVNRPLSKRRALAVQKLCSVGRRRYGRRAARSVRPPRTTPPRAHAQSPRRRPLLLVRTPCAATADAATGPVPVPEPTPVPVPSRAGAGPEADPVRTDAGAAADSGAVPSPRADDRAARGRRR